MAPGSLAKPHVSGLSRVPGILKTGAPIVWSLVLYPAIVLAAFGAVVWFMIQAAAWILPMQSHPDQDMTHFRYWIEWIRNNGIEMAYAGLFPTQYVIYPPLSIYFFHLVGQLQLIFPIPPDFIIDSWPADGDWSNVLVRLPVLFFHLLITFTVYWSTVRWKGVLAAAAAAAAYGLNPAVLFDLMYWAQPDSYHSFFAIVGLLALLGRWPEIGWAAFALAALAKPQAWVFLPILGVVTFRRHGLGAVLSGAVFFVVAALPVVWPFLVSDRIYEMASVFVNFSRVMPVVSANAHNLWWSVVGSDALIRADSALAFGPFSYQTIGFVLLLGAYFMGIMKVLGDGDRKTLFSVGGFVSLAFFMFATEIHENHAFLVFPMLAMCWVADLSLAAIYVLLTATMFGNLSLHDPVLEPLAAGWIAERLPEWLPYTVRALITPPNLQALSVVLNFYALALWLATFIWGGAGMVTAKERQRRAAWAAAVGGGATLALALFAVMTILKPACPAGSTDPACVESGPLAGKISTRPVDEAHDRIVAGGGGTDDPVERRTQTIYVALGGAFVIALVTLTYAGYQGQDLRRSRV